MHVTACGLSKVNKLRPCSSMELARYIPEGNKANSSHGVIVATLPSPTGSRKA